MTGPLSPEDADRLFAPFANASGFLLALSGGPDSTCLLHLAAAWRARIPHGPRLFAATVDHGLRPEAEAEAAAVARWSGQAGVPHAVLLWRGPKPPAGIQNAARDARYALLAAHAATVGADVLMTAHHADDQAETVLMRLLRGSGIHGLAGMASFRERAPGLAHARPFLAIPKERLVATLQSRGLRFFEDPSNADPKFFRTHLRDLAPRFAREGLDRDRLVTLAARARRADEALDQRAAEVAGACETPAECGCTRLSDALFRQPDEIMIRVLIRVLEDRGGLSGPLKLERVETLAAALRAAHAAGRPLRRSIAGSIVSLDRHAGVTISGEPARTRGRRLTDS